MKKKSKNHKQKSSQSGIASTKDRLHKRNRHRNRYDFESLVKANNELSSYVQKNKYGDDSIDFSDPKAVLSLNTALLYSYYNIVYWDIPKGYLCPPIPGRADYIHHIADMLALNNYGTIPQGSKVCCMDIGVGANCIYPIIGNNEYRWSFIGVDIDDMAIKNAKKIVDSNPGLKKDVELRLQTNPHDILLNILKPTEEVDLVVCNPPFHESLEEATDATKRKLKNLNLDRDSKPVLNFGGKSNELWCKGGELKFITDMIIQSKKVSSSCLWFSTLISKHNNVKKANAALLKVGVKEVVTLPMGQGNKTSRVIAWTFHTKEDQKKWAKRRWK